MNLFPVIRLLPSLPLAAAAASATAAEPTTAVGAARPVLGADVAVQLVLGLGLVVAAIVVTAWVARRMLQLRPGVNGQLRVLGGLSVGGRERVVLVQVGRQQLVLGVAPGRVQALHVLDEPIADAAAPAAGVSPPPFAAVLRRIAAARGEGA